MLQTTN